RVLGCGEDLLGGRVCVGEQCAEPRENRRRGLSGQLLIDDRLSQRAKDARRADQLKAKRADCVDDARQGLVASAQVIDRGRRLETEPLIHSPPSIASMRRFVAAPPWAEKPPILPDRKSVV